MSDVYWDAAATFLEDDVAHVCWAVAIADGYSATLHEISPATVAFQWLFANLEEGADKLHSYHMLDAAGGNEAEFRELSLMLLAMMIAVMEDEC